MTSWFAGRSVLITGAASGIGAAAAQRFAQEGASVCLADIDESGLKRVSSVISEAGGRVLTVRADVSRLEDNEEIVRRTIEKFGSLDVAFLNAGVLGPMNGRLDTDNFDRIIKTNLYGCFYGLATAKSKISPGGAIVVSGSITGITGFEESPAYSASKHGVVGLVRSVAATFAARKVRVNAICPGGVATPMVGAAQSDILQSPQSLEMTPYRTVSSPQQIAELVVFLASPNAAALTGGAFVADAGWTATQGPPSVAHAS